MLWGVRAALSSRGDVRGNSEKGSSVADRGEKGSACSRAVCEDTGGGGPAADAAAVAVDDDGERRRVARVTRLCFGAVFGVILTRDGDGEGVHA